MDAEWEVAENVLDLAALQADPLDEGSPLEAMLEAEYEGYDGDLDYEEPTLLAAALAAAQVRGSGGVGDASGSASGSTSGTQRPLAREEVAAATPLHPEEASAAAEEEAADTSLPSTYAHVDEELFIRLVRAGCTGWELQSAFSPVLAMHQVNYLKRKHRLQGVAVAARHEALPSVEEMDEEWRCDRHSFVQRMADAHGVSANTLRRHCEAIGFALGPPATDEEVLDGLAYLRQQIWCASLGVTFADARLRTLGIHARPEAIRRCLKTIDPFGAAVRAKQLAKTKYRYSVPGPRSLYHGDAHEKLAKLWGIWLHLLIDGYSRRICYLAARPNKFARMVQQLFLNFCEAPCELTGAPHRWSSRVRWDKGRENVLAALSQVERMGVGRGSVLTGRSIQNMRAEYVWVFVRKHITGPFRALFFDMMRQGILDISNPHDLWALHVVYLPLVQTACNDFVAMWNTHRIAGGPVVDGFGGGIPDELWQHTVLSETVRRDDEAYQQLGEQEYGVDEPTTTCEGEEHELSFAQRHTADRLASWPALQELRDEYFLQEPFSGEDAGVSDYQRYRSVSSELELAVLAFPSHSQDTLVDWEAFHNSQAASTDEWSSRVGLRSLLSTLAYARYEAGKAV